MTHVHLVTLLVDDYDEAIAFFTNVLQFDLVEDTVMAANDGSIKRWVVVRAPGAETGLLLARATTPSQNAALGHQTGDRVGFFLHVDSFDTTYARLASAGVAFLSEPRHEPYGTVVVFIDPYGNRWDLIEPTRSPSA